MDEGSSHEEQIAATSDARTPEGWFDYIERLESVLKQIADPSYVGNYDAETVVDIYRSWAKLALDPKAQP